VVGGLPTDRTVYGFAVSPLDPKMMYAAMRDGLFKTTDAGQTWKAIAEGPKNVASVAVNPRKADEVYISTADGGIFRSIDGGMTWGRQR
jgi:photosystem II stability/assembly factor-like uncharacterized protein